MLGSCDIFLLLGFFFIFYFFFHLFIPSAPETTIKAKPIKLTTPPSWVRNHTFSFRVRIPHKSLTEGVAGPHVTKTPDGVTCWALIFEDLLGRVPSHPCCDPCKFAQAFSQRRLHFSGVKFDLDQFMSKAFFDTVKKNTILEGLEEVLLPEELHLPRILSNNI